MAQRACRPRQRENPPDFSHPSGDGGRDEAGECRKEELVAKATNVVTVRYHIQVCAVQSVQIFVLASPVSGCKAPAGLWPLSCCYVKRELTFWKKIKGGSTFLWWLYKQIIRIQFMSLRLRVWRADSAPPLSPYPPKDSFDCAEAYGLPCAWSHVHALKHDSTRNIFT